MEIIKTIPVGSGGPYTVAGAARPGALPPAFAGAVLDPTKGRRPLDRRQGRSPDLAPGTDKPGAFGETAAIVRF
jgi:hypothetical protein